MFLTTCSSHAALSCIPDSCSHTCHAGNGRVSGQLLEAGRSGVHVRSASAVAQTARRAYAFFGQGPAWGQRAEARMKS